MLYPFTFHPIFKERVWGGRKLEELFNKRLPPGLLIGESWEISDRPGDVSLVANGPLAGKDLHWLVTHHPKELLGHVKLKNGRFPLLIKILDAREQLSLQVHPPPGMAKKFGGDPKTELWYVVDSVPEAEIFVGLKRGTTRKQFERLLKEGTVGDGVHRVHVARGDAMFLPSGRVHAIGAGLVLFEIQQNSDTTYRVFDWNRLGLDGKPRELHPAESMASIDFKDFEPALVSRAKSTWANSRVLVQDPIFHAKIFRTDIRKEMSLPGNKMHILGMEQGQITIQSEMLSLKLEKGEFSLIPANVSAKIRVEPESSFVLVQAGKN
jgi:mannose-6-phosphate isomerase